MTTNIIRFLKTLGPIDAKNVQRDALLRWIVILPLGLALAARWMLPLILLRIEALTNASLMSYYPPFMGYALLLITPVLIGMVVGFLLLDQRDDRTLLALQMTPLPLSDYLAYRLATPVLLTIPLTLLVLPLAGFASLQPGGVLLAALLTAPLAPLVALVLATFAENKVQGFALLKALGIFLVAPIPTFFVQAPWQWLCAIIPTYWPAKFYWAMQGDGSGAALLWLIGMIYQLALIAGLWRRFNRVLSR